MRGIDIKEAYRKWNREQALRLRWERELRRISQDIEAIGLDMAAAWADGDTRMENWLNANPKYRATVNRFLDMRGYKKDMEGWRLACGTDLGLFKRTRRLGWPRLWRVILESRKMRTKA